MSQNLKLQGLRRGVTLVELLVALAVVAVLSTAVAVMLAGAGKTNQYVNNETTAMSQVETAYRRIMHNVRTASAMSAPTDTTAHTPGTLTISTQPDSSYGSVAATVTYSVSGGNLVETDSRYGTNTLVTGVATFTVQRITSTSTTPTQISITITSATIPVVTRTAIITCRNF